MNLSSWFIIYLTLIIFQLNLYTISITVFYMYRKKRAQVSMEYMVMVGFTLFMIIPIMLIYGSERQSITNQVSYSQAKQVATKIVDSAEKVYYLGKPSQTTIRVYIPQNIDSALVTVIFGSKGR